MQRHGFTVVIEAIGYNKKSCYKLARVDLPQNADVIESAGRRYLRLDGQLKPTPGIEEIIAEDLG